jgi:hypothetical protein
MITMSTSESYNGWANRETWAVALWINNEQRWQELVHEELRAAIDTQRVEHHTDTLSANKAGDVVRENVENLITVDGYRETYGEAIPEDLVRIAEDIGSLYRVDWHEIGTAFLADLAEQAAP